MVAIASRRQGMVDLAKEAGPAAALASVRASAFLRVSATQRLALRVVIQPSRGSPTDSGSCLWLRWASEEGNAPAFVRTVAEAEGQQYRQLGIPRFSELCVRGFLSGGGYDGIPLEVNTYDLGRRFELAAQQQFSVAEEVARWVRGQRF